MEETAKKVTKKKKKAPRKKANTQNVLEGEVLPAKVDSMSDSLEPSMPGLVPIEPEVEVPIVDPSEGVPVGDSFRHYLAMARKFNRLPELEERDLGRSALKGDQAAGRKLVLHNLRLVVTIAYAYRKTWDGIVDLLQEGTIGLLEATQRWDPEVGPRFGTYAAYWIRACILRFLMTNSRLIHTGNTRAGRKLFWRLERERQKLLAAGVDPSPKLLAAHLDVKPKDIQEVGEHLASQELSLDSPTRDDAVPLSERIPQSGHLPDSALEEAQRLRALQDLMDRFEDTLKEERDQVIWQEHLRSSDPVPLSQLAQRYGVSRQRMAQIADRLKKRFRQRMVKELGSESIPDWLLSSDS